MPYEGGIIEGKNIKKWIAAKTKTLF